MSQLICITRKDLKDRGLPIPRGHEPDTYRFLLTDDDNLIFTDIGDHCTALGRAGFPPEARDASEPDCVTLAAAWGREHVVAAGCWNREGITWKSEGLSFTTPERLQRKIMPLLEVALFHMIFNVE